MYIVLPVVSFICAILLLLPLPNQLKSRNTASVFVIAWLITLNLIRGVNTIAWGSSLEVKWEIWCEIATRVLFAGGVGLPTSAMCLCQHLYNIVTHRYADQTPRQRMWRTVYEWVMCLGVPMLSLLFYWVNQGHRFDIVESFGCEPTIYNTWVAILTLRIPPLLFATGGVGYSLMALLAIRRQQKEWRHLLSQAKLESGYPIPNSDISHHPKSSPTSSSPSPTIFTPTTPSTSTVISTPIRPATHTRLVLICVSETLLNFAINLLLVIHSIRGPVAPWISWDDTHWGFNRVDLHPWSSFPPQLWTLTIALWSVIPLASLVYSTCFIGGGTDSWLPSFQVLNRRCSRTAPKESSAAGSYNAEKTESTRELKPKGSWDNLSQESRRAKRYSYPASTFTKDIGQPPTATSLGRELRDLESAHSEQCSSSKKLFNIKIPILNINIPSPSPAIRNISQAAPSAPAPHSQWY